MSPSVLFLSPYPRFVASHRVRIEQYVPYLVGRGVRCEVRSLFDERAYRRGGWRAATAIVSGALTRLTSAVLAGRWDAVFVHREALPLRTALIERTLGRAETRFVFDFDDAIYLPQPFSRRRLASWLRSPGKFDAIVGAADRVLAGNAHLAARALRSASDVRVLPSVVDTERLTPAASNGHTGGPIIGWMGSPSTAHYLADLVPVLRRVLDATPSARLEVVGAPLPAGLGPRAAAFPWSAESEGERLRSFDIGLMPLPDDEWARGKCGYKALQYMSAGVATISSPVGVASEIADSGRAGLLASTDVEWEGALRLLLGDPPQRRALAEAGRARVVERYSLRVWAPQFHDQLLTD